MFPGRYDNLWFACRWFVFVIGPVPCLLGCSSFVLVFHCVLKLNGECVMAWGMFAPAVKGPADDLNCRAHTAMLRNFPDVNLLLHGEELNHPKPKQRPVQFDLRPIRIPAPEFATTKCLFDGAELKLYSPTELVQLEGLFVAQLLLVKKRWSPSRCCICPV